MNALASFALNMTEGGQMPPWILADITMAAYVRDDFHTGAPTLSSSVAHTLLSRSPLHARFNHPRLNPAWEPDEEGRFDLGAAAHAVLLEGRRDLLAVCNFGDWRTKLAQQARDDAREQGKIPVLLHQAAAIEQMVDAAQAKLTASPDLEGIGPLLAERTCLWQERGTWLRCRPDWLSADHRVLISYKTSGNAEPDAFVRGPMQAHSYDLQAAFELAGVKAATGVDATYLWLVSEVQPPYEASLVGLAPEWRAFAETKFKRAVEIWADCLRDDRFPAYPDRICYPELPPWLEAKYVERHGYQPPPVDDGRPIEEVMFEKGVMP